MHHDFCKKKQENVVKGFVVIEVIQSQEKLAKNYLYLLPKGILILIFFLET
jgi:hypothetical protein